MKTHYYLGILAVVFSNVLWGLDFIAIDYMTEYMPTSAVTFFRLLFSTAVLLVVLLIKERKFHIEKADWPRVFISGVMGVTLYTWFECIGIQRTSGSLASLILATVPIFGLLADRILYKNSITPVKIIGIIVSIAGVAMIVGGSGGAEFSGSITGVLFMLTAAISWTLYIVLVKPLNKKYSILTLTTALLISGTVAAIPLFLLNKPAGDMVYPPTLWIILVVSAVASFALGGFTYIFGVSKLSVTKVVIFENILPIVAIVASYLLFKEMLSTIQLVGGAIVLIACAAVSLSSDSKARDKKVQIK
ncbi:MAG: DMT family transporter [Clostridiales bacterium]|jgi:drug/metabolite transporter (DMT)-like permease|nr:DMT family transporter [Clostridiales bacterium]